MRFRAAAILQRRPWRPSIATALVVTALVSPQIVSAQSRRGTENAPSPVTPRLVVLPAHAMLVAPPTTPGDSLRHQAAERVRRAIGGVIPASHLWVLTPDIIYGVFCTLTPCEMPLEPRLGPHLRASVLVVDAAPTERGIQLTATLYQLRQVAAPRRESTTARDAASAASALVARLLADSTLWHLPRPTSAP